jgi:hypothetical protein
MMKMDLELKRALKNPNVVFASPEVVENSTRLTPAQKRMILLQWKDQLRQLLVADDESMLHARAHGSDSADCLRRVMDSMIRLPGETSPVLN